MPTNAENSGPVQIVPISTEILKDQMASTSQLV